MVMLNKAVTCSFVKPSGILFGVMVPAVVLVVKFAVFKTCIAYGGKSTSKHWWMNVCSTEGNRADVVEQSIQRDKQTKEGGKWLREIHRNVNEESEKAHGSKRRERQRESPRT
jgi:hypothetical protein